MRNSKSLGSLILSGAIGLAGLACGAGGSAGGGGSGGRSEDFVSGGNGIPEGNYSGLWQCKVVSDSQEGYFEEQQSKIANLSFPDSGFPIIVGREAYVGQVIDFDIGYNTINVEINELSRTSDGFDLFASGISQWQGVPVYNEVNMSCSSIDEKLDCFSHIELTADAYGGARVTETCEAILH